MDGLMVDTNVASLESGILGAQRVETHLSQMQKQTWEDAPGPRIHSIRMSWHTNQHLNGHVV